MKQTNKDKNIPRAMDRTAFPVGLLIKIEQNKLLYSSEL